jgi:hypothetical protein
MSQADHLRALRFWTGVVMTGLVLSGLSAFPIETELRWLVALLKSDALRPTAMVTGVLPWITRVYEGFGATNRAYPFLAYGTDWLAFAHLVIAFVFVGAYRDPIRNRWLYQFGLLACVGVLPLAVVAGAVRGIPWGWTLLDCSFGVFCAVPLLVCEHHLKALDPPRKAKSRKTRMKSRSVQAEAESWLR